MRTFRLIMAIAFLAVGAFLTLGYIVGPQGTPGERIKIACAREFGPDTQGATECEIRLSVTALAQADQARTERAIRSAGL